MDIDTFWNVIEAARAGAASTDAPFDEVLVNQLADRPRQEILEYAERFDEVHDALYRWDVWAAAYLIGGGCSDDSFMDFRAGVITLGRQWYNRAAAEPDSLAEHPDVVQAAGVHDEVLFYEDVKYAASGAFERITGEADAFYEAWRGFQRADQENAHRVGLGEDFDFDDDSEMSRRLPRLAALILGSNRQRLGSVRASSDLRLGQDACAEKGEGGPSVHGSLECSNAVDVAFDDA